MDELEEVLKIYGSRHVAEKLNLSPGTVKRWIELGGVPGQYLFDLLKMLERPIDYGAFTSKDKDQFFTPEDLVRQCWDSFRRVVPATDACRFIEPSAGDGAFLKVLPAGTIALDIEPRHASVTRCDFLTWRPPEGRQYVVFGNPPFGLRGHLALAFINHAAEFSDYVCFILPQLFESDGKGSPRKRVKGLNLIHSEPLSAMFYTPDDKKVKINGVFQIWSKHTTDARFALRAPDAERLRVYSLSDGGTVATTRNKAMLGACDVYLPSTCFGRDAMRAYDAFEELPGRKGYGIVFHIDKIESIARAKSIDWANVSFLSTNSALNLRTSIIHEQFAE
jgi:predicted RNA methylase